MADISRYLQQFNKHYSTVHMQQGRVIIDSDWNERASAEAEDRRGFFADIMCAHGTPNDGMLITGIDNTAEVDVPGGPSNHPTYTFKIQPGSYYVGGLRFVVDAEEEDFLTQPDWLQIDSTQANLPVRSVVDDVDQWDLVYIHCWEQSVTAIEDSELREVALGGRDTTTRTKRMRRYEVLQDTSSDCAAAFSALVSGLTAGDTVAEFDASTNELVSKARLQVTYDPADDPEDLCATQAANAYMGAENQAIRVELRAGGKLVWGFDNASKLYRVEVGDTDDEVVFIDGPEDIEAMPRVGEVVEILRWGAKLPNDEKVAEPQGAMFKVAEAYDPVSKAMLLDATIDSTWIDWLTAHIDHYNDDDASPAYFYLRVWRRSEGDAASAEIDHTISSIALGRTGLRVEVIVDGLPGDYWIIAARPDAPDQVTPWDLDVAGGVAPHGPRRFYAPLALIRWEDDNVELTPSLADCRIKMRQLCEGGCCTVTVGDGQNSFGTVNTLAEAVGLVSDGGKICVLPGVHEGTATLTQLSDVLIEGCGPNTILTSPQPEPNDPATGAISSFYDPVLNIVDCTNLRIQNLRIESHSATGVEIVYTGAQPCENILLEGLEIYATGKVDQGDSVYEYIAPCVAVLGASDVTVRACALEMGPSESLAPAALLAGTRLRLLDSTVVAPKFDGVKLQSPGGVNIASGSYDVEILRCTIDGGWGYGVSLGTVAPFDTADTNYPPQVTASEQFAVNYGADGDRLNGGPDDCIEYDPNGTKKDSEDSSHTIVWLPLGPIERVKIQDCTIRNMGLSGIATLEFFDSTSSAWTGTPGPVFLVAGDIDISHNEISENVQLNFLPPWIASNYDICFGGVCLAASINAVIHDNYIHDNGVDSTTPICGVGLVAAQNALIEDNRIIDNGLAPSEARGRPVSGMRGGIAITEVSPLAGYTFPTSGLTLPSPVEDFSGASPGPALTVRGNEVRQKFGRAIMVRRGFGAINVTGNTFEARGNDLERDGLLASSLRWQLGTTGKNYTREMLGATAEIVGLGLALDRSWGQGEPPKTKWTQASEVSVTGGNVMVTDNVFSLEWTKLGGEAASVLVSSLGSVMFDANSSSVIMNNTYDGDDISIPQYPNRSLLTDVVDEYQSMSLVFTNVFIGGNSIAQAIGNRLTEPQFDALFSIVTGPPVGHLLDMADIQAGYVESASALVGNAGSHCCVNYVGTGDVNTNNVSVFPDEDNGCPYTATKAGLYGTMIVTVS